MQTLLSSVTADEMEEWHLFYEMHPFDDLHRYHRPAAWVGQSLAGGDLSKAIDWLHGGQKQSFDFDDIRKQIESDRQ